MTNTELYEEINCLKTKLAELEEKVSALPNEDDSGGVFQPEFEQTYWFISDKGGTFNSTWTDSWIEDYRYSIGNCFPNKQAAEDAVRVLKLIQKARESQDGFVPDWENGGQDKYCVCVDRIGLCIKRDFPLNVAPTFGYWEGESMCEQFINENHDELIWFFTEYER